MQLPSDVIAYKKTRVFDQDTVPQGLTRNHCTARGVWAMIHILEGSLVYRTIIPPSIEILDLDHPAIVAPEELHEIALCGPVRFYIEFYSKLDDRQRGKDDG